MVPGRNSVGRLRRTNGSRRIVALALAVCHFRFIVTLSLAASSSGLLCSTHGRGGLRLGDAGLVVDASLVVDAGLVVDAAELGLDLGASLRAADLQGLRGEVATGLRFLSIPVVGSLVGFIGGFGFSIVCGL